LEAKKKKKEGGINTQFSEVSQTDDTPENNVEDSN
jgi:hypothetical protein